MPALMSLEGPHATRLAQLRGQLYAAAPRSFWRTQMQLNGITDPIFANKWLVVAGVFLGFWLAGSTKGQAFMREHFKKR